MEITSGERTGGMLYCLIVDNTLRKTNFFESAAASEGWFHGVFINPTFHLLIPKCQEHCIAEMKTGKLAVITKGINPKVDQYKERYEIMFDDNTHAPLAIELENEQIEHEPHYKLFNQMFILKVYKSAQPEPQCVLELPCGLQKKEASAVQTAVGKVRSLTCPRRHESGRVHVFNGRCYWT